LINSRLRSYTFVTAVLHSRGDHVPAMDRPAQAKGATVLHARGRVFPDVGRGAEAIERDAAGHYYVWRPRPASSDLQRTGNASENSNPQAAKQKIKYAVDFDRDAASGRIFVADRGANAVKIFTADGALKPASVTRHSVSPAAANCGGHAARRPSGARDERARQVAAQLRQHFHAVSIRASSPCRDRRLREIRGYAAGYSTSSGRLRHGYRKLYSGAPGIFISRSLP